ncbi:glutathione binding-like protein [Pusillimonas sp. ANT_WB101]|uniref:glutathione binding-like protein n=1 Tax=Pusillimonas sp. ANT_WB101 TaxID=2597356 RepID=UPI0011ECF606|nr:glutathione binding-like protein [Pusillimonas sp. ANT_WB101]KAA0910439.1 thiol:disulfide oxidoreductase [Pusillimonas sp. ANT_WB101]
MIDLYYWTTPNGHKITILLEEIGMNYQICPIHIGKGEQFAPNFLTISPNNRIPAIVDHEPASGDAPFSLFESGAILTYLAEKADAFLPTDLQARHTVMQWLFWQVGGLGPMAGQNHHFGVYAPEQIPYAINRYVTETERLYRVLDHQLSNRPYVAGEYSIADMAIYPWVYLHERQRQDLANFPNVRRWFELLGTRKAIKRAYALSLEINPSSAAAHTRRQTLTSTKPASLQG